MPVSSGWMSRSQSAEWAGAESAPFIVTTKYSHYKKYLAGDPVVQSIAGEQKPVRVIEAGRELTNKYIPLEITSIHGYHPVTLRRYKAFIDKYGFYSITTLNLFNVRYLVSRQPIESDEFNLRKEAYGKRYYSLKDLLPYAYFPENIIEDTGQSLSGLEAPDPDLYS